MNEKRDFIRSCFICDQHGGHRVGLTPPKYQSAIRGNKHFRTQVALWDFYEETIESIQPIDFLASNGDGIDGRGERSGGSELLTNNRHTQCDMTSESILLTKAKVIALTRGTPYHVGQLEEFEDIIAKNVNAIKIEDHAWYDINGVIFDVKHQPGGTSGVPHTSGTAITMDHLWNIIWNDHNLEQPRADVTLRAHTHSFSFHGNDIWLGIYQPALQGMGSKFGAKQCRKLVHFGIIWFDIFNEPKNGVKYIWDWKIAQIVEHKAKALDVSSYLS